MTTTVAVDSLRGTLGTRNLFDLGAAAPLLIGGFLLWRERSSTTPDAVRRWSGIFGIALGPFSLSFALRNIAEGNPATGGVLGPVSLATLVLGMFLVVAGVISLGSQRYAAWYLRKWEKRERRRKERRERRH
jgi:hypothetical protein